MRIFSNHLWTFTATLSTIMLLMVCQSCKEDETTVWDDLCGIYSNYEGEADANLTVTYNGQQAINKEVYIETIELSSLEEAYNNLLYSITLRNITSIDNLTFRNIRVTHGDNFDSYFSGDTIINGKEISFDAALTLTMGGSGNISPGGRALSSMVLDVTETAIQ